MSIGSQQLESYLPVYDTVPETWEEARQFLIEQLKKISNAVNVREIGWFLDQELLSGKQFIPGAATPPQVRSVFRKVINTGGLVIGLNPAIPHGITFDINFTLVDLWVAATNSTAFTAINMSNPQNVTIDATNIIITSTAAFNRSFCIMEFMLEQ